MGEVACEGTGEPTVLGRYTSQPGCPFCAWSGWPGLRSCGRCEETTMTIEQRAEKDYTDFDASQRLVHTDPTLKKLATSFLACEVHYAGSLTHSDPSALEWAAWDAYYTMLGGRNGGRDGVLANMQDSGFYHPDNRVPPCLDGHVDAVMGALNG